MLKTNRNIAILNLLTALLFGACKTSTIISKQDHKDNWVDTTLVYDHPMPDTSQFSQVNPIFLTMAVAEKPYSLKEVYTNALKEIEDMLDGSEPLDFKRAVFITENAYFGDSLDYGKFSSSVELLAVTSRKWMDDNHIREYNYPDSINFKKNAAILTVLKDTIFISDGSVLHFPFDYNFDDYAGQIDWSNQFVLSLLSTGKGNCHSLPYLYKILANELKTEAYLSLAPNHIYIKHRSKKWGWYNTELTSGEFPSDAWVKASGYITLDAIRSGIFMDTLSERQSVALCAYDLAQGYLAKTGDKTGEFIISCCDLVLKYHSSNTNAMILKAETLLQKYYIQTKLDLQYEAQESYAEMQSLYMTALRLGYREMPPEMYLNWLSSIKEQRDKYTNKEIKQTIK